MKIIELKRPPRFAGSYEVYQKGEDGCPETKVQYQAEPGDYVSDIRGLCAQVLAMTGLRGKDGRVVAVITTVFGKDMSWILNKGGSVTTYPLDFARDRNGFYSIGRERKAKRLTRKDKNFLRLLIFIGDATQAFMLAYGMRPITPSFYNNLQYRVHVLLQIEEGRILVGQLLREAARERGLDKPEFYLDVLIKSIQGGVKNDFDMKVLAKLAIAGGNSEMMGLLPYEEEESGAKIPLKAVEAEATVIEDKPTNGKHTEVMKTS